MGETEEEILMEPYITKEGDQWDRIAKSVYGQETMADTLMAANQKWLDVFQFGYGVVLNVPDAPAPVSDLPSWRT